MNYSKLFKLDLIQILVAGTFFGLFYMLEQHFFKTHGVITMGTQMIGNQDLRIAYVNAYRSLYDKATKSVAPGAKPSWMPNQGNKILSQSDLRSEIVLNVNKTTYQFGINVNQQTNQQPILNTERRLNLQDTFFVAQIGYYFRVVVTAGGSSAYTNQLFTHPPGQIYNPPTVNLDSMVSLWNGNMSLAVNNRTIVPEWDLFRHYVCPDNQAPVFGAALATQLFPVNDALWGAQDGMYPVEPMWILDGSYDNVMNITFNNALNLSGLANTQVNMVVIMRGILAQNCGKIMEPGMMNPM